MLRIFAIAAMVALVAPTIAAAQQPPNQHRGPAPAARGAPRPAPGGPHPQVRQGAPARGPVVPHGPAVARPVGPHPGAPGPVAGRPFMFRGHPVNRVHIAPFVYPHGWAYRRWAVGAILPPLFLVPAYYYTEWAALGLPPPDPGLQWVRYGPDLLLVNTSTGQVVDVAYGVFY